MFLLVTELDARVGTLFRDEAAVKDFLVSNDYLSAEVVDTIMDSTINFVEVKSIYDLCLGASDMFLYDSLQEIKGIKGSNS